MPILKINSQILNIQNVCLGFARLPKSQITEMSFYVKGRVPDYFLVAQLSEPKSKPRPKMKKNVWYRKAAKY